MASLVVIDSEPIVRTIVTRILERAGHSVRATGDFREAISMLNAEYADLVLTNVFLKGISGHEAMRLLRSEFPAILVLMIAGLPDEEAIAEWGGESRFDVFPKPFASGDLVSKVEQMLSTGAT